MGRSISNVSSAVGGGDASAEFINNQAVTLDQLAAGLAICAPGAKSAVVKQVDVVNSSARPLSITAGATTVASITGNDTLLGDEYVASGNSLVMKTLDEGIICGFSQILKAAVNSYVFGSAFVSDTKNATAPRTPTSSSAAIATALSTNNAAPAFACYAANGDFYYTDRGSGGFFRRAGGVNGVETTYAYGSGTSPLYAHVYDGSRYIYSIIPVGNGTLSVFDTTTNTYASRPLSLPASFSNVSMVASYIDGYIVFRTSTGNAYVYLINVATGVATQITVLATVGTGTTFMVFTKDDAGNYWILESGSNGIAAYNIGQNLATPKTAPSNMASSISNALSNPFMYNGSSNGLVCNPTRPPFVFWFDKGGSSSTDAVIWVINLNKLTMTKITVDAGTTPGYLNAPNFINTTKANYVADFGVIGVRATGVIR